MKSLPIILVAMIAVLSVSGCVENGADTTAQALCEKHGWQDYSWSSFIKSKGVCGNITNDEAYISKIFVCGNFNNEYVCAFVKEALP